MKSKAVAYLNYFVDTLHENPKRFHGFVVFSILFPMILAFTFFNWNLQILIFLSFGYASAFIGYHLSNGTVFNRNTTQKFRKHYRLIAENLKDIVIIHRLKDGKNEYSNAASKTILGYAQQDLIGQATIFIIHPKDRRKVEIQLANVSVMNDYFFVETIRVRCKDGAYKWMEVNVKTLKNEFGKSGFAIFTFRDISETIELEKANKKFAEELYERYLTEGQKKVKQLIPRMSSSM